MLKSILSIHFRKITLYVAYDKMIFQKQRKDYPNGWTDVPKVDTILRDDFVEGLKVLQNFEMILQSGEMIL